jgi:hypothetical protein
VRVGPLCGTTKDLMIVGPAAVRETKENKMRV